jgi:Rieske Fe-S protein
LWWIDLGGEYVLGVRRRIKRVCPLMGCPSSFSSSATTFVGPCHRSEFEVGNVDVIVRSPPYALTRINVAEGTNGNLYLQ